METGLRPSGVEVIGSIPWGTHLCQFYRTKHDLIDILVPYFTAGLKNNEFCMWVTSEPLKATEARTALQQAVPDLDRYLEQGQLEIIPYTDWYLLNNTFDDERVLNGWVNKLEQALEQGYAGLRLSGNTLWLERKNWPAFTDYEVIVNNVISRYRMLAICTYCLDKCDGSDVIDVIRNHQFALIKQEGKWDIIESTIYKQAREALRESEEKYRNLFNTMNEGFGLHEIILDDKGKPYDYRFLELNEAFERLTGLPHKKMIGKTVKEVLPDVEPYWIETYGRVALTGQPVNFEDYSAPLGKWYSVYAYSPAPNQFAVLFGDITGRKKAEVEVSHLASFPGLNPNPVLEIDTSGNVIYSNPSIRRIFPDLPAAGSRHPFLTDWAAVTARLQKPKTNTVIRDVNVGNLWFEQMFAYVPETRSYRLYGRNITKRKEAEEALKRSQRDLNHAQEVARIGSWRLDMQNNELLWSEETHRIFGVPKKKPMTYDTFLECVHPEDREYVNQAWTAALCGEPYDLEHRIIAGDKVKWVREKAELELDETGQLRGGFGTAQDITDQKKVEERLVFQSGLLDTIEDAILATDVERRITYWGRGTVNLLGWQPDEVMGRDAFEFLLPESPGQNTEAIARLLRSGQSWSGEITARRRDGTLVPLLIQSSPVLDASGQAIGAVAVGKDIAELKEIEKLKDEFISLVSHELRTPLTVIAGSLRTALSPGISPENRHELMENAVQGTASLAAILENMLELSRFQANRLQLQKEKVNIQAIAESVINTLRVQGAEQQFRTDFPGNLAPAKADPVRLERILYNLLENAVKYSPKSSVVTISGRNEPGFILIGVADQGTGITPDDQGRLFELFERLERETTLTQGLGLGLVVCKRLVEAQGGRIWVESEPDMGATFYFTLPIHQPEA